MRTVGPNGLALIQHSEGTRLDVYRDSSGFLTVGTGHLVRLKDNLKFGDTITQEQADAFLAADLADACAAVEGCGLDLTQNQFDALVDFALNEGAVNLAQLVENADRTPSVIADHFSHYTRSGTDHPRGLRIRRMLERDLFLTPDGEPLAVDWLSAHSGIA